jgi:hypothetical protein
MAFGGVGLPEWMQPSRHRIIRMMANPLDKSTIVSIVPKHIRERNHTITPGLFEIPASVDEKPQILVVGPASWFKEMEEGQPFLEISNSSIQVADSVVRDYCNGLWCCDMMNKMPGLFYLPGEWSLDEKLSNGSSNPKYIQNEPTFLTKLIEAKTKQRNWMNELIFQADIDWARTNGNPIAISDDARLAARILHIEKPWIKDFQAVALESCKACGELINPAYPVCRHCHAIIDEVKAKELNIRFAVQ